MRCNTCALVICGLPKPPISTSAQLLALTCSCHSIDHWVSESPRQGQLSCWLHNICLVLVKCYWLHEKSARECVWPPPENSRDKVDHCFRAVRIRYFSVTAVFLASGHTYSAPVLVLPHFSDGCKFWGRGSSVGLLAGKNCSKLHVCWFLVKALQSEPGSAPAPHGKWSWGC